MRTRVAVLVAVAVLSPLGTAAENLQQRFDPVRNRSWTLTRDGVLAREPGGTKTIALPQWHWVDAPSCPPDLGLGPRGEAVVTSNVVPVLWRIDAETLAVSVHPLRLDADTDKDVGFAAIVYSADQRAFIAYSDMQRTLWRIDTALTSASKMRRVQGLLVSLATRCMDAQR